MVCPATLDADDHGGGENWKFFAQQSEVSQSKHAELKSKKEPLPGQAHLFEA